MEKFNKSEQSLGGHQKSARESVRTLLESDVGLLKEASLEFEKMGLDEGEIENDPEIQDILDQYKKLGKKFEQAVRKFKMAVGVSLFSLASMAPNVLGQELPATAGFYEVAEEAEQAVRSPEEIKKRLMSDEVEKAYISFSDQPSVEFELAVGEKTEVVFDDAKIINLLRANKQSKEIILSHTHPFKAHEALGAEMKEKGFLGAPPSSPDILNLIGHRGRFEEPELCVKARVYGPDGVWDFEASDLGLAPDYKKLTNEILTALEEFASSLSPEAKNKFDKILNEDLDNLGEFLEKEELFAGEGEKLEESLSKIYDGNQKLIERIEKIDELQQAAAFAGAQGLESAPKLREDYISYLKSEGIMMRLTPNSRE